MYYNVSITAVDDRDESCCLYKLTWHFNVDERVLTPATLAGMISGVKDRYLGSWPTRNMNKPSKSMIRIDVTVTPIGDMQEMFVQEATRGEGEAA